MAFTYSALVLSILAITFAQAEEPWRFIVLADWHSAEKYTQSENNPDWLKPEIDDDVAVVKMLKKDYGGDLIMLPGDSNNGHWKRETILEKGRLCYGGMVRSFREGGYDTLLMAVGDHEVGDNPWPAGSEKSDSQYLFREAFANVFTMSNGKSMFNNPIGSATARPLGTIYENTSFAFRHKNVLFVTVDVFRQDDPKKAIGIEGSVTGSVTGKHLQWLESVLAEARKDTGIKHIIVQSHLPVIYPVRKVNSSGMLMDHDVDSDFWKLLRAYNVDLYFAGEVHANTVTKDPGSDIVQIVSRGNFFSNFLTVDVGDDEVKVVCHNLTDTTPGDGPYEPTGTFSLKKTDGKTIISGNGELALLDRNKPLMHFDFEERFPLPSRPVIGQSKRGTIKKIAVIDGTNCIESFANTGVFGQMFDAHHAHIDTIEGAVGKAGSFSDKSRMAVFGMGPHYPGRPVSYALWVKTTSADPMVLINTGSIWHRNTVNFMNLNLRNGKPEIMVSKSQRLVAEATVNDGNWHHIALSIDKDNSKLSELSFYVDGKSVGTKLVGKDQILKTTQSVRLSVGCFGYSRPEFKKMGVKPFTGALDEVIIWARGLDKTDIEQMYRR